MTTNTYCHYFYILSQAKIWNKILKFCSFGECLVSLQSDIPCNLEHIPACTGSEAGYITDWSQIYKWAKAHRRLHTNLFCLLSSKGQQKRPRARLQQGALTESHAVCPHRVHHLTTTFTQIPETDPHVPSLTASSTKRTKQDKSCSYLHISKHMLTIKSFYPHRLMSLKSSVNKKTLNSVVKK